MAKYKVTYETSAKPSTLSLPVGAKVTQMSVLPAKITGSPGVFGTASLRIEKSATSPGQAYVQISDTYDSAAIRLTKAQAKDAIEALQEIPDTVAFIAVDCYPAVWLNKAEAQQVVDALKELIDA